MALECRYFSYIHEIKHVIINVNTNQREGKRRMIWKIKLTCINKKEKTSAP